MHFPIASVRSSGLGLAIAIFLCFRGGFSTVGAVFAGQSVRQSSVGTRKPAAIHTGESSLRGVQAKSGAVKTLTTTKLTSQSVSHPTALQPFRQRTATKIVPHKQPQKITKTAATVSKAASSKTALSKNQTAALKTATPKSFATIPQKNATVASSKVVVQKSTVSSKVEARASSNASSTRVSLKTLPQAVSQKQISSKIHSKQSVIQPKTATSGASSSVRTLSPLVSMQLAFSLNTSVRLSDAAKQLHLKYSVNGQNVILSDGRNRFEFQSGTKEAKFNNIRVFLAFPIEKQFLPMARFKKVVHRLGLLTEEYHIRTADIETVVKPLLFPQSFVKKRVKTIVIDPGHGGKADGTVQNGLKEKLLTLKTAQLLACKLRSMGYVVFLTRTTDVDVSLNQRSAFANMKHADLFVSVHYNSASSAQARGIEVFTFPLAGSPSSDQVVTKEFVPMPINGFDGQNSLLGWSVQEKIIRSTGSIDRGVKRKRLAVLRELNCPGILIECGFLSHPTESKACNSADYQEKLTQAIADGIRAYNGG